MNIKTASTVLPAVDWQCKYTISRLWICRAKKLSGIFSLKILNLIEMRGSALCLKVMICHLGTFEGHSCSFVVKGTFAPDRIPVLDSLTWTEVRSKVTWLRWWMVLICM